MSSNSLGGFDAAGPDGQVIHVGIGGKWSTELGDRFVNSGEPAGLDRGVQ